MHCRSFPFGFNSRLADFLPCFEAFVGRHNRNYGPHHGDRLGDKAGVNHME